MSTEVLNEDYMLSNKTSLTTYVQTDIKNWMYKNLREVWIGP